MTQEWANLKNEEHEKKTADKRAEIMRTIQALDFVPQEAKDAVVARIEYEEQCTYPSIWLAAYELLSYLDDEETVVDALRAAQKILDLEGYERLFSTRGMYDRYVDSEPMHFDGDIVITDPGYTVAELKDWRRCCHGYEMEVFGITNYMTRDTIYGDWSCTTFDADSKTAIGHFCADAGLVSVLLLDEVLRYNPGFANEITKGWTATVIRDFVGEVQFVVTCETAMHETDGAFHKAGEVWEDFELHVVGHGKNKVTGEPINFITSQTGI